MQSAASQGARSGSGAVVWHLGTIGFAYPEWVGSFYPKREAGQHRLTQYAEVFPAVEIDATFYAVPALEVIRRWGEAVPGGFRFCLKTPREVTHGLGKDPSGATLPGHLTRAGTVELMRHFVGRVRALGAKLGMVLIQFPASFKVERLAELERFLRELPQETKYAVEFRDDAWWVPETAAVLRDLGVAWVASDDASRVRAGSAPSREELLSARLRHIVPTAGALYVRWMGTHDQYEGEERERVDPSARLEWWAARLKRVLARSPEVTEVYAFFGNGFAGHGPATARRFAGLMGIEVRGAPLGPGEVPQTLFGYQNL